MNDESLARLYDAHGRRLFRRLLVLLGRAEDAEDALQNLFVKLARAPGSLECEAAYLDRAARNEAIALLRKRRRPPAPPPGLFARAGRSLEEAEALDRALARIPREQAEVVLLKVVEGMTFAEIADFLDVPPDTAASRYRYGIEKLRAALEARRD